MTIRHQIPIYLDGRSYSGLHTKYSDRARPYDCRHDQVISLTSPGLAWTRFWQIVSNELQRHDYSQSTIELYRSILRSFWRHSHTQPSATNERLIHDHLDRLVEEKYSWSWIGMNISVLRSVFDKLGGMSITTHLVTPKRPSHLPEILSRGEIRSILAAAPTTRDQLLLGLMYGCGLKVGEVCRLRWCHVDTKNNNISVLYARQSKERTLDIPPDLLPVLELGKSKCSAEDYLFQGRFAGKHLSTRMAELILRKAVRSTDILKTVTCMVLRHSYAVHCIEADYSIRAVQEALGHQSIDTTMLYERCILPKDAVSPIGALRERQAELSRLPNENLFAHPLSIDALELPFQDKSTGGLASSFYRLLKTHIFGRFLCSRRSTIRAG